MSRLVAPPPDDRTLWRQLLACVHPDAGGDKSLFVWATAVRESLSDNHCSSCPGRGSDRTSNAERIPYDDQLGYPDEHTYLTMRAYSIAKREEPPYARILEVLLDCPTESHGRVAMRQCRGASFKQLGYISHLAGLSKEQRGVWYEIARSVPLSEQHAHHLIGKLK